MTGPRRQNGATLIEVLVAMLILAIGLLGLAGLQTISVQSNQGAYFRSQATILANDIVDRMRANRVAALANRSSYSVSFPTSNGNNTIAGTVAQQDVNGWLNALALTLPQGTGSLSLDNTNNVTVIVCWNDRRAAIKSAQAVAATNDTCNNPASSNSSLERFTYRTQL
ncbi:type IV pilus modification protein PilV [uncultured Pseudomonas sp.]|uniref:type IV pilus modification protein PilV n=1 Tax=uncultured Pseudomonas sp. TaxID=114707 RepID=UPI0025D9049A|nr:type IV pilus modification protein PilV [uncultured Pseudomonas sp.]